jgi:hypothetical protein
MADIVTQFLDITVIPVVKRALTNWRGGKRNQFIRAFPAFLVNFARYHGNDPITPVMRRDEQACSPSI